VQLVSRDRSVEYADTVRASAPQALQIADKFHLLKNLREALQQFLERKRSVLPTLPVDDRCQAIPATARGGSEALANAAASPRRGKPFRQMSAQPRLHPDGQTAAQEYRRFRRDARYAQYEIVRTLVAQRVSHREMARRLGLSRETVARSAQAEAFPELPSHAFHPRRSRLDPFKAYLRQHCEAGCWNGKQLYAEIQTQGFAGSQPTVRDFLTDLRQKWYVVGAAALHWDAATRSVVLPNELPAKPEVMRRISPARASWLMFLPVERLADDQRVQRDRVRGCHPDVEAACTLVSEFVQILTERRVEALDNWLTRVGQCHLAELQRFARGVRRDEAAVKASCASNVSNGQVEGQITRLKLRETPHVRSCQF
jgi:transposase